MKLRYLILLIALIFSCSGIAQVTLEKSPDPAAAPAIPNTAQPPATTPPADAVPAAPMLAPLPPEPPQSHSPIGLLVLGVIMAHVSLPITLIGLLLILIIVVRVFKSGLTKFLMGVMAAGGGMKAIKSILVFLGCVVVFPAGLLGINFAGKILDHRVTGPTWWIYGIVVSIVTGFVFFALAKAVGRGLKKQLAGKMGGLGGMMGGMGGFGGMGGGFGLDDQKRGRGGKQRRR